MIKKIAGAVGKLLGSDKFVEGTMQFIRDRWPAKLSEGDRIELELVVKEALHNQRVELLDAEREDQATFNEFVNQHEGTASDLKGVPIVGPLIIFLRGAFRPLFSYGIAYVLLVEFFPKDTSDWPEQKVTLLFVTAVIVLVFYFGERALKNLLPLIGAYFGKAAPAIVDANQEPKA